MKVLKNQTIYVCEHCGKHYRTNYNNLHETFCSKNPLNKHACFNCVFLDHYSQPGEGTSFTCTKKDIELFSYKAEKCKQYGGSVDLTGLKRMPLECDEMKTHVDKMFEDIQ